MGPEEKLWEPSLQGRCECSQNAFAYRLGEFIEPLKAVMTPLLKISVGEPTVFSFVTIKQNP